MAKKTKEDYVDLRSPADLPMFNKVLKTFEKKGIYILVHADFCGPCQRYKESVWNHLVKSKNRKAGVAAIHYDQLENSPFSSASIKGYPSVLYVTQKGTVKNVSKFKDEAGTTNAMPNDVMQNKELMETLVNSEPKQVQQLVPSMETTDEIEESEPPEEEEVELSEEEKPEPPPFSEGASKLRNHISGNRAIGNINAVTVPSNVGTPPKGALLDSQKKNNIKSTTNFDPSASNNKEPTTGKGSAVGGTLYSSLLKSTRRKKVSKKKAQRPSKKLKLR
jgi:thiol-disulfide isomerase/thioredoxin